MTMGDWKEGANKRRDARHTKAPDEPGKGNPKATKKKDTKRWCRGKVGVEHKLKCMDYSEVHHQKPDSIGSWGKGWKILACTVCGKELERWYPMGMGRGKNPKPEWVK
jgi:hypothetical protein